jgi:hypothetical protein
MVNAGGLRYVDSSGRIWQADQVYQAGGWGYVGGQTASTTSAIAGTSDPALYQSDRYNMSSYRFDAPHGLYEVTLRLAEIYPYASRGSRVFDVRIENQTVFSAVDVYAARGLYTAYDLSTTVQVVDGQVTIDFIASKGFAAVNAIHVLSLFSASPTATPSETATVPGATATRTTTATRTGTATLAPTVTATVPGPTSTPTRTGTASATPTRTTTATATATQPAVDAGVRVNAGGSRYVDGSGRVWQADQVYQAGGWGYVGGQTASTTLASPYACWWLSAGCL